MMDIRKLKLLRIGLFMGGSMLASVTAANAQSAPAQPESVVTDEPAQAQPEEPQPQRSADNGGSGDIVVTAQRRAQRLQDVPISITAVTGEGLQSSGIVSTEQIALTTPGFIVGRQRRNATPYVRGIGTQASGAGIEPAVPIYVDGVYYFGSGASLFYLNNIERVELIRGPQGTLFGRNSTGGLVNVVTRDPQVEPSVEGSINYGNYDIVDGSIYLTGGSGNVAVDFAGHFIRQGEGFGTNLINGQDINVQNETSFRSRLLWRPSPDDRITLAADWTRDKSTFGVNSNIVPGSRALGGYTFTGTPYDSPADAFTSYNSTAWGGSIRWEHDFGNMNLSALSAYRQTDSTILADVDDTPLPTLTASVTDFGRIFQNEVVLSGTTGRLDFTAGVFIMDAQSGFNPQAVRSPTILAQNVNIFSTIYTRSYAGFAQGTYRFAGDTSLTIGGRYTIDQLDFNARTVAAPGNPNPVGTVLFNRSEKVSFSQPTWRVSLDHRFTPDIMAYVSYNRGFKSGTFSASNVAQPAVRPETLDALEGGLRIGLLDNRARLNISGFHYWAEDIQLAKVSVSGGAQQLLNAAQATFYGGEIEFNYRPPIPTGTLDLNLGLAYLHGRYSSFPGGPRAVPNANGGNTLTFVDLSGNTTIRSPEFTFNAGIDYAIPVGDNQLAFNVTYYHNSGFFWEPDNRIRQPAYDLVNAQIAFSFGSERQFTARLWGRNLTDQVYYTFGSAAVQLDKQTAERPRTYGVGLDFRF